MVTTTELYRLQRAATAEVIDEAIGVLTREWSLLDDYENALKVENLILPIFAELAQSRALAVSAICVNVYDEMRAIQKVKGRFRAMPSKPIETGRLLADTGWSVGPLYGVPDPDMTLSRLEGKLTKSLKEAEGDTFLDNARRDHSLNKTKVRVARVPEPGACDWCRDLGGRGFSYLSAEAAGQSKKFHDRCRCDIAVWMGNTEQPVIDGYDPDALYKEYLAREAAEKSSF